MLLQCSLIQKLPLIPDVIVASKFSALGAANNVWLHFAVLSSYRPK